MAKSKKIRRKGYTYDVKRKRGAISVTMKGGKDLSRKEAVDFFRKHPRATHIQKRKGWITAGTMQPDVPSSIKVRGKTYRKAYMGPHTKRDAHALHRSFEKGDKLKTVVRKTKRGYFVYYRDD